MNVRARIELGGHFVVASSSSRGRSQADTEILSKICICARPSDAFLGFLSRFSMNMTMRVFTRLTGSLISRASLLDGNDGENAMDRRKRILFLSRKSMSSLGARKSLILARLSDKKKCQDETSRFAVNETDWKVLESLLRTDALERWKVFLSSANLLWQLIQFCSLSEIHFLNFCVFKLGNSSCRQLIYRQ